jgi:hypothetical protein
LLKIIHLITLPIILFISNAAKVASAAPKECPVTKIYASGYRLFKSYAHDIKFAAIF